MLIIAYFGNAEKLKDAKYDPKKLKPIIILSFLLMSFFVYIVSYWFRYMTSTCCLFLNF